MLSTSSQQGYYRAEVDWCSASELELRHRIRTGTADQRNSCAASELELLLSGVPQLVQGLADGDVHGQRPAAQDDGVGAGGRQVCLQDVLRHEACAAGPLYTQRNIGLRERVQIEFSAFESFVRYVLTSYSRVLTLFRINFTGYS